MWRSAIAGLAMAAAASANSPEPSPETLAAVAATCTAQGAFGYDFGHRVVVPSGSAGIAPFTIEDISRGRDGLYEITAAASFARAPMSEEDRGALAGWVFNKLAAGIAARKFARRQDRRDGIAFIAGTFVLDLSRDGTMVRVTCTDIARRKQAREAMREH